MQVRSIGMSNRKNLVLILLAAGIAVHILFLLSLRNGWFHPLFNDSMHRFGPGADFFSVYASGVKARHGESLYTIGGHVEAVPYAYAFRYAPLVAYTLGLGLSLLPALSAYGLWLILCELALLRNIRLTLERAPDRPTGWLATALWLLFSPYYLELYVGQFTFLAASLVFWAYLAWKPVEAEPPLSGRGGRLLGDLAFGVSVWLKLMPLLYLPLALLRGRWKGVLLTLAVLALSTGAYFWRFPGDWAVFVSLNGDSTPTWHAGNQGLMALLYTLAGEHSGPYRIAHTAALLLVGGGVLWLWAGAWRVAPFRLRGIASPQPRSDSERGDTGAGAGRRVQSVGVGLALPWLALPWAQQADRAQQAAPLRDFPDATSAARPISESPARAQERESRCLALYAACSAAYLLLYKDVWEHHYTLLLPPLVLLALRRAPARLWLFPFVVCALPTLFACYDVQGLGFNEDPQRYWRPAVSLLHHGWKPLAPLWLFLGLIGRSLILKKPQEELFSPAMEAGAQIAPRRTSLRRSLAWGALIVLGGIGVGAARWAGAAIAEQKRTVQILIWSDGVFALQQKSSTCGPAALAAVCRHYGIPAEESEIARLAGTTSAGTSMLGLLQAARAKGMAAEGRSVSIEELLRLPMPSILFFHQGHFAVLTGVQNGRLFLADPTRGQHLWTKRQLEAYWAGDVLLVGPAEKLMR